MGTEILEDKNVLLIDDDLTIVQLVTAILQRCRAKVTWITNPEEGFGMEKNEKYDVVILDRYMQHVDGHDILAQFKQHPTMQDTPVIMLSGESKSSEIMESIKLGAAGYVVKPFDEKGFLHQIVKILSK